MARKLGRKNVVKPDYCNYAKLFNGIAGIGKTTLFFDITQKLYGEDGGMLITIGHEPEPIHIPNALYERAETWNDFEEIVETLCEDRATDYAEIKEIGIDSVDEIFRLAERKVISMHNRKYPDKKTDTIKSAFGGYQAGEDKVVDIVTDTIFKLRNYGYGITLIGHTKTKGKKDELTEVEYELLTSNLPAKYYNAIKDKVNLVGTAYVDREYTDLQTAKNAYTKGEKVIGRIASEQRIITFRDEEHAIDVKSHFPEIIAKCEFSADAVIKAIEDAINCQLAKQHGSNFNVEEIKEQQAQETLAQAQERVEVETVELTVEQYHAQIKEVIASLTAQDKKALSPKLAKVGLTPKFDGLDVAQLKQFLEIISK